MREDVVQNLVKNHGTLEQIRFKLGLNKRQMAQLLCVDPSAWTRWTSLGADAPAHVYQALSWYLQLIDKAPAVHEKYEVQQLQDEVRNLRQALQNHGGALPIPDLGLPLDWQEEKASILQKIETNQAVSSGWKLLLVLNLALLFYLILIRL